MVQRRASGGGVASRDDGGGIQADPATIGTGGIGGLPPSAGTMNPLTQGMIQRYASLPQEKREERSAMLGPASPQGRIVRAVLARKRVQPQAQAAPQQQAPQPPPQIAPPQVTQPPPQVAEARGGIVPAREGGGPLGVSMSMADPWWTRREAYAESAPSHIGGFLAGSTAGRADAVATQAPGGSYVLPADVIAGLGDGNSLAGARVMDEMLRSGPHGIPMPAQHRGRGAPEPPRVSAAMMGEARGGIVQRQPGMTPVMLSHGEYVISPAQVAARGGGDVKRGHRIRDKFVLHVRKNYANKLRKLPGPVKPR